MDMTQRWGGKMKPEGLSSRFVKLLLTLVMIASFIPGGLLHPFGILALPEAGPAITNYPSQFDGWAPGEIRQTVVPLGALDWDITDHMYYLEGYYTPSISMYYNGYPTRNHVVFDDDKLRIFIPYGPEYAIGPMDDAWNPLHPMNMIFTDSYSLGFSSLSFTMRPLVMDFDIFSEAGFLFNGSFSGQYYTGYALILKCGNLAGMLESGVPTPRTAVFSLIYIENELMDCDAFQSGTIGSTRTLIGTYRTNIPNGSTPSFDVHVDSDLDGSFQLYVDGVLAADIVAPQSTASGFGFYAGCDGTSYSTDNGGLSVVEFEQIQIVENLTAVPTTSTVKFVDIDTGNEIANEQTKTGYVGDQFKVTPPLAIEDYRYVKASLNSLDPINYRINSISNVITLYYDKVNTTKSSNGGRGTLNAPITVEVGDSINYFIDVVNSGVERSSDAVITDIWCGADNNIARDSNGEFWVWGNNNAGQLGLGDTTMRNLPTKNDYLGETGGTNLIGAPITGIWCGMDHTIARDSNGDFWVWGWNLLGQLGSGDYIELTGIPIYNAYLSETGSTNLIGAPIIDIRCGEFHTIALSADGDVRSWGYNEYGQLGLGDEFTSSPSKVTPTKITGDAFDGNLFVVTDLLPEGLSTGSTLVYSITDANGINISGDVDLYSVTVTNEGIHERITFKFLSFRQ